MQPPVLQRRNSFAVLFSISLLFAGAPLAFAATGNIDATHKYAFSNVGGYINFAPTNGGVTVTSSTLSGYAWSANDGWINFDTAQSGVVNDGNGTLSGFAWDSSAGWVNFSGVTIDSDGEFHGQATGGTVSGASYAINFDCTNCSVITTWRPASSEGSGGSQRGGGGSAHPPATPPSSPPTEVLPPPPPPPGSPPAPTTSGQNNSSATSYTQGPYTQGSIPTVPPRAQATTTHATASASTTHMTTTPKKFSQWSIFLGILVLIVLMYLFLRFFI